MKPLAALLLLMLPSLAQSEGITVLGWSKDEQFVAVRIVTDVMSAKDFEAEQKGVHHERGTCPNYIDPVTKRPFYGELAISVFKLEQRHVPMPGSSQLKPVAPPFVIYKTVHLYHDGPNDEEACSSHREAKRALAKAKASMKKHGIDLKKPGKKLALSSLTAKEKKAPNRVYKIVGWTADKRDELSDEIERSGPIEARIRTERFHDNMSEATIIGRFDVVLVRREVPFPGSTKLTGRDPDDGLIGSLPLRVRHPLPHAGDAGFAFEGVFASPSKRVLLFGVQTWNFDGISGHTRRYKLPFAYMRWDP
jgi:hypothetical protein